MEFPPRRFALLTHVLVDGHGQKGVVDPYLLQRAVLVSALCLKRLDGMKIEVSLYFGTLSRKANWGRLRIVWSCSTDHGT